MLPIFVLIGVLLPITAPAEAADVAVPVTGPLGETGRWLPPVTSPVLGIHAAVLPTGKVLLYSYPDMMGEFQVPPPSTESVAYVWNPLTKAFKDVSWDYDVFCSGHSFLPDGRLYVTGGWEPSLCEEGGLQKAFFFDPWTEAWSEAADMTRARYYPSNVTLGDGRVVVMSGYSESCHPVAAVEIFTPGGVGEPGTSRIIPGASRAFKLYPQLHLLKSGKVAMVGPDSMAATFDPETAAWRNTGRTKLAVQRYFGTSVEIPGDPGRIMICGGYRNPTSAPTETCEIMDFKNQANPSWQYTGSMHFPRAHLNPVILPDKTILMVGGGTQHDYQIPVRNAELYDPRTGTWKLLPAQKYGRMYHSTAVLLPDGRVLSAGHDQHRLGIDSGMHENGDWYEIYRPAYTFRGPRPKIGVAPTEIAYKQIFEVITPEAAQIDSVVLISLSAVTHSTNTTQRLVDLAFEVSEPGKLRVAAPQHKNLAPAGYYMLFILDGDRVPSKAKIIHIDAAGNAPQGSPPNPGGTPPPIPPPTPPPGNQPPSPPGYPGDPDQ